MIKVVLSDEEYSISYVINLDEEQEMFREWQINGANPNIGTFEQFHRPIQFKLGDIGKFNTQNPHTDHFIFGWFESQSQSDEGLPFWVQKDTIVEIIRD